jgi:outer membrane protein OmpA-like peptidoglycan-associated protein
MSAHTDSKGSDEYNFRLSDNRARSVMEYILSKGIDAGRITSKGYGESMPVSENETDEGRQLNRRVEFKILKN